MQICSKCHLSYPHVEFFKPQKNGKKQCYCKECNRRNAIYRQQQFKIKCLEYKGGKCIKCGYDKCISALEFHHRDPSQKEFHMGKYRDTSWVKNKDKVKKELDKCDLLCSNCHREHHHQGLIEK
jgi:hypothetical protein